MAKSKKQCLQEAKAFLDKASKCINQAVKAIGTKPEAVHYLGVKQDIEGAMKRIWVSDKNPLYKGAPKRPVKSKLDPRGINESEYRQHIRDIAKQEKEASHAA